MTCECYDIGLFDRCKNIQLPFEPFDFDAVIYFQDGLLHRHLVLTEGDPVVIPFSSLNEDRVYYVNITKIGTGEKVHIEVDDDVYDCITFQTTNFIKF